LYPKTKSNSYVPGPRLAGQFLNTVTLTEEKLYSYGMEQGAGETYDRLEKDISTMVAVTVTKPQAAPHLAGMAMGWNLTLDRPEAEVAG
jgi:hypothetical protein